MIGFLLACLLLLVPAPSWGGVDDLACVLCHPSRDRAVFEALGERPGVLLGSESAQEFVCWSCHNGSVVDSRATLGRGAQHPVGFQPGRSVPEPFPLYPGGRLECGTCHSPHGEGPGAKRWLRVADDGQQVCAGCHAGHREGHLGLALDAARNARVRSLGGRAGPQGEVVCTSCHAAHGGRGAGLLLAPYGRDQDDLCRLCHGDLGVKGVAAAGRTRPCADCHVAHAAERPFLAGGERGPCAACHAERGQGGGEHPLTADICSGCHSVHRPTASAGAGAGLLKASLSAGGVCRPCHGEPRGPHGSGTRVHGAGRELAARRGIAVSPDGALGCDSCHRMHRARGEALTVIPAGILCLYCHEAQNPFGPAGSKNGVHPVGVLYSDPASDGDGSPDPAGAVLVCATCHGAHAEPGAAVASCGVCHPEQGGGADHGGVAGCGACHQVHGSEAPARRCVECHSESGPGLHDPQAALTSDGMPLFDDAGRPGLSGSVSCATCHDPHAAEAPRLRAATRTELCLACHPDQAATARGRHGVLPTGDGAPGTCAACHPSHGSPPSESEDPLGAACRECHGGDLQGLEGHGPGGAPAWHGLNERLPLFDRFGKRNAYGFMTCPSCHDVHQGAEGSSLRLEAGDPPQLCLACHGDKSSLLRSRHDPRQGEAKDACGACHPVHSRGESPPLWELRSDAQGSWNDRKCSGCHRAGGSGPLPHAGPTSHPVNRNLPDGMRAEGLPLFDPLGGDAGRVLACGACHDIHGTWSGASSAFPRFLRKDPTSGDLCLACHPERASVVGTQHDLSGSQASRLGPCGPCHVSHGAREERYLWGLEPAPGEYLQNRLCRSCHGQDGPVRSEFLLLQHHMKDAEPVLSPRGTIYLQRPMLLLDEWALKTGDPSAIPLYDRAGDPQLEGSLQCVSCHDPHQWSPLGAFVKPGFGALGPNVPTHFLRLRDPGEAERSVCAGCHLGEAAEHYRFYHRVWEDVGVEFR